MTPMLRAIRTPAVLPTPYLRYELPGLSVLGVLSRACRVFAFAMDTFQTLVQIRP
jgi:hypothetical protein